MAARTTCWVAAAAALVLPAAAVAASEPAGVEAVLAKYETEAALSGFLGPRSGACVTVTRTTRLCEWILAASDPSWRSLAEAIGTGDRVGVLCELPDGQADETRRAGTCTGHARRSNRSQYDVSRRHSRTASQKQRRRRELEGHRERAREELAAARSTLALSRLLGCKPDRCEPADGQTQLCTWRLSNHTGGHGTVAASIGADLSKKVRLACHVPLDGSDRAGNSCRAQIGP